ncbi:MAG: hypothetical protein WCK49_11275 [Myxococcaceae bacterium]
MRIFCFSLMGCVIFSLGVFSFEGFPEQPQITEVNLSAEHVYFPVGFDSNDDSEVIVGGWYPNPCYEWSHAVVNKKENSLDIQLKALKKEGMDTVCIDMAVPYLESIKLGALKEGPWPVQVEHIKGLMHISKPNSASIDDYLYGQVRHVSSEGKTLVLDIELPSSCIQLDQIKTVYNGADTCSVLPIMKKVKDVCPRDPQSVNYRLKMPEECLATEKVLFHVRSLEGKAVNFLFKNR